MQFCKGCVTPNRCQARAFCIIERRRQACRPVPTIDPTKPVATIIPFKGPINATDTAQEQDR